jgi:predicted transcriptional regulator
MKILKVGIATREEYKKRTIKIAKGEYVPAKNEPKAYFESVAVLSQVADKYADWLLSQRGTVSKDLDLEF